MKNIARNIKRLNSVVAAACLVAAAIVCPCAHAQDSAAFYTTRGIAPVPSGNISAARAAALTDAQQKAVLAALAERMSLEQLTRHSATLQDMFISKPEMYVQRFKIIDETTLPGIHQVRIEAVVAEELLAVDLETIGVLGPARRTMRVLIMAAEEMPAGGVYAGWWSADPANRTAPLGAGSMIAELFRERGIEVIDENDVSRSGLVPQANQIFPDREAILEAARRSKAAAAVLTRVRLRPAVARPGSGFMQVQCDIQADVLDVRTRQLLLQTETNALGMHIDRESAAQDAVQKACLRIVQYVVDRMPTATGNNVDFCFRCTFPAAVTQSTAHDFFKLLRAALPEIKQLRVRDTTEADVRLADIISSIDGAALAHKALQADLQGYRIELGVIEDRVINLRVTPPGAP